TARTTAHRSTPPEPPPPRTPTARSSSRSCSSAAPSTHRAWTDREDPMDFTLPETAVTVREGVARAVSGFDHAYWSRCDEEHRFPDDAWQALADGGWIGLV